MNYDPVNFSKNLVKGRIAETLFEQMLRDAGCFTILSFGYEQIIPELAHRHDDVKAQETMEIIRRAPDFAVINNETHDVFLIEVKYLMRPTQSTILTDAKRMFESWRPSYLFLATPDGFFFDKASDIVKNNGDIKPFSHPQISTELQKKYTQLLNEFIEPKSTDNNN
ncbi:MAG: hypothetical protein HQK53_07735 [Oligoflexia bacterium]|nr:hypothetical protein [Oligoflexia bacterium]